MLVDGKLKTTVSESSYITFYTYRADTQRLTPRSDLTNLILCCLFPN